MEADWKMVLEFKTVLMNQRPVRWSAVNSVKLCEGQCTLLQAQKKKKKKRSGGGNGPMCKDYLMFLPL